MKGDAKVIDALNRALTIELTAINQYFCQAKMCKNWGFMKLGKKHYEESIGEMKHADKLIDRILFLEGVPEIARYDVIRVGTNVKEQFENDLKLEMGGVKAYNELVELCASSSRTTARASCSRDPDRVRGTRRLAGDAARPDRGGRAAELPDREDGGRQVGGLGGFLLEEGFKGRVAGGATAAGARAGGDLAEGAGPSVAEAGDDLLLAHLQALAHDPVALHRGFSI